jgi:hypothetical protein
MSEHRMIVEAMRRIFGRIPELEGHPIATFVGKSFVFTVRESTEGQPEGYIGQILGIKWVRNRCILKIHQTTIYGRMCSGLVYFDNAWHAKHDEETYVAGELTIFYSL